jgi:hypothetical protein
MKAENNKPDISILVRSGHFYFGWTTFAFILAFVTHSMAHSLHQSAVSADLNGRVRPRAA